uniref:F-box domain-containing protein n=1 Tax=Leersia perrieri TaxID=77586 RepID=A0A0D9X6S4_9ORYZ
MAIGEQILIRIPPDDPASLIRAAYVCKGWHRLTTGAGFRRRLREFHKTPPMLGFLCNFRLIDGNFMPGTVDDTFTTRFFPTSSYFPIPPPRDGRFVPSYSIQQRSAVAGGRSMPTMDASSSTA